jgi:hypothetical protein
VGEAEGTRELVGVDVLLEQGQRRVERRCEPAARRPACS